MHGARRLSRVERSSTIPRIALTNRDRRTVALYAGAGCAITLLHAALSAKAVGYFSADSWSYFELSKSVFADFYRIATVRQYSFDQPYGVSFPPLYPVLIALWNVVWHSGVYAGTWINLASAMLTLPLLIALGRRLAASNAPGILAFAALLGSPWYLNEVMSARAIPIALLLFFIVLLLVHRVLTGESGAAVACAAGAVAGLVFEARFDFLLPAIAVAAAFGVALAWMRVPRAPLLAAAFVAGLAAAVAPWVVYSLAHFGVPLVSDNARTATAIEWLNVMRFVPFPETIATIRTAPAAWLSAKVYGSWPTMEALAIAIGASPVPVLAGMAVAAGASVSRLPRDAAIVLGLGWIALSVNFALTATTGYPDVRYWIGIAAWGTFTAAAAAFNGRDLQNVASTIVVLLVPAQIALLASAGHGPDRLPGIFSCLWPLTIIVFVGSERYLHDRGSPALARAGRAAAIAVPAVAIVVGSALAARATGTRYSLSADATARTLWQSTRLVEGLDGDDPSRARVLVATVAGAPMICEFGARTGVFNLLRPTPPFGWVDLWLFVHRYGVTHAIVGDHEVDARLPVLFAVRKSANGALWKIEGDRPGLVVIDTHAADPSFLGGVAMRIVTNDRGPVDAAPEATRPPHDLRYPILFVPRD